MATGDIEDADHTKPEDTWGPAPEGSSSSGNCKYRNEFGICLDCEEGFVLSDNRKDCVPVPDMQLKNNLRSSTPTGPLKTWSNQGSMCANRFKLEDLCRHNQILDLATVECKTCPAESLEEKKDNMCISFGKGIRPNVLIRLKNGSR